MTDTITPTLENPKLENPVPNHDEITRLREHNKTLLAELKAERDAKNAAQSALEAAQAAVIQWRDKWHTAAVISPLDDVLRDITPFDGKMLAYARDELIDLGLLKMEPDADGLPTPTWLGEDGNPADLKDGIYRYLSKIYDRAITVDKKTGLAGADAKYKRVGSILRGNNESDSGSGPGSRIPPDYFDKPKEPEKGNTSPIAFGLK